MKYFDKLYATITAGIISAAIISCNDNDRGGNVEKEMHNDRDTLEAVDSTMSVHHKDPATAFPQPPVTGTMKDSGNVKDSMKNNK